MEAIIIRPFLAGDAHGLGGVRERELRAAAKALQVMNASPFTV